MPRPILCHVFLLIVVPMTGCIRAADVPTRTPVNEGRDKAAEEEFTFVHGSTTLVGTLVRPPQGGPCPVVLFLAGSSRGDRKGYLELGRHLAAHGIAAFCYDSPGTGRSTGKRWQQSLDERTEEACVAVLLLRNRADLRPEQIGVWGISQGASVAIMTAARSPDVAFVIPVSTSGVSGFQQMLHFARSTGQAHGLPPDDIAKLVTFVELFFEQMRDADSLDFALMEERVRAWQDRPWLDLVRAVRDRRTISPGERLTVVQKCLRSWRDDPWWKPTFGSQAEYLLGMGAEEYDSFLKANRQGVDFDPRPYLKRVRCPALVLSGADDVVVPVEKSAAIYRRGLEEAGNRNVTITIFPGGNHSIQDAKGKYLPAYLDTLVTWIHARTGRE